MREWGCDDRIRQLETRWRQVKYHLKLPYCPRTNLPTPLRPVPSRSFDGHFARTVKHVRWKVKKRGQEDWRTGSVRERRGGGSENVSILWVLRWSLVRRELAGGLDSHRFRESVSRPGFSSLPQRRPLLCPSVHSGSVVSGHFILSTFPSLTYEFVIYCLSSVSCSLQHTVVYEDYRQPYTTAFCVDV